MNNNNISKGVLTKQCCINVLLNYDKRTNTQRKICMKSGMSSSQTQISIIALEGYGIITREGNRRNRIITLTRVGERLKKNLYTIKLIEDAITCQQH